jgi:hypothetical protein
VHRQEGRTTPKYIYKLEEDEEKRTSKKKKRTTKKEKERADVKLLWGCMGQGGKKASR